ncbi:MAG: hypothetical protein E7105_11295 [Prevotella sp.]|nr:hypothetical protein [Prevotella sp.]
MKKIQLIKSRISAFSLPSITGGVWGWVFLLALTFTACIDEHDEPPADADAGIYSLTSVGDVNITIADLKTRFHSKMTANNTYTKVLEDLVFEGTVVGNDITGNLYQKLCLSELTPDGAVQSIYLSIKCTNLYSFFPVGCTVRVNLKGLWIGNYGYVPTIGTPYKTSAGNMRLGVMLLQDCRTHVQLVQGPDEAVKSKLLTPKAVDATWLGNDGNKNVNNTPMLATMEGTFSEADGERIFAPNVSETEDPLNGYDAGYARNRTFKVGKKSVLVRTSTRNEISNAVIPSGRVRITGILTYYGSDWQFQMRSLADLEVLGD